MVILFNTVATKNLKKRSYDNLGGHGTTNHATDLDYIHDTQFCTDVSSWGPVEWVGEQARKCNTTFVKEKKERSETVCDTVTELLCNIVPYTKCKLEWINENYTTYEDKQNEYVPYVCDEIKKTVQHKKMMPKCYNETKLNCVTLWKTNENGQQVWAGNENCEEVKWKRCELVPELHNFTVPEVNCSRTGDVIPWDDCVDKVESRMTTKLTCKVHYEKACKPKISRKCQSITYNEWFEKPVEICEMVTIQKPQQTWEHKKKCLFPDNGGDFSHHHQQHHHHGETTNSNHHGIHHSSAIRGHHGSKKNSKFLQVLEESKQAPRHPSLDGFNLDKSIKSIKSTIGKSLETEINKIDQILNDDVRTKRNIAFKGNGKITTHKNPEKLTIVTGVVEDIIEKETPK